MIFRKLEMNWPVSQKMSDWLSEKNNLLSNPFMMTAQWHSQEDEKITCKTHSKTVSADKWDYYLIWNIFFIKIVYTIYEKYDKKN